MQRTAFFPLFALLFVLSGPSGAADAGGHPRIMELMTASGLAALTDQLAPNLKFGMEQAAADEANVPEETRQAMLTATDQIFGGERVRRQLATELAGKLTKAQVAELMIWYDSEVGRRISAAESAAGSPDALEAMGAMAGTLMQDPTRVVLMQQIEAAAHVTDTSMEVMQKVQLALLVGTSSTLDPEGRLDLEDAAALITEQTEGYREQVAQLSVLSLLYAYRDVPEADLQAYKAFLEQPAAMRFHVATNAALGDVLAKGIMELLERLSNRVQRQAA